jgi:hypothetical protein
LKVEFLTGGVFEADELAFEFFGVSRRDWTGVLSALSIG